jgi:hypothetical protein
LIANCKPSISKRFNGFLFGEYYYLFDENFWKEVQRLAKVTGDSYIFFAEVDNYYNERMGWYEWVKIPVELSYENYMDIFNMEKYDDGDIGLAHYGFKFIFTSPSLQWGIWAEREIELYVYASKNDFTAQLIEPPFTNVFNFNETLEYISADYKDTEKVKLFCDTLIKNYK